MKKIISLLLALTMVSNVIVGCGNSEGEVNPEVEVSQEDTSGEGEIAEDDGGSIEVDKNLTNVQIKLPASLFEMGGEEIDIEQISKEAKEEGIKEVTLNEDGSITYTMSKATHSKLVGEMKDDLFQSIDELIEDEEIVSIQDITMNKNFSKIEVIVDKVKFKDSFDGIATMGVVFGAVFLQLFDGADLDDFDVVLDYIDMDTGEVFESVIYPEDFNK